MSGGLLRAKAIRKPNGVLEMLRHFNIVTLSLLLMSTNAFAEKVPHPTEKPHESNWLRSAATWVGGSIAAIWGGNWLLNQVFQNAPQPRRRDHNFPQLPRGDGEARRGNGGGLDGSRGLSFGGGESGQRQLMALLVRGVGLDLPRLSQLQRAQDPDLGLLDGMGLGGAFAQRGQPQMLMLVQAGRAPRIIMATQQAVVLPDGRIGMAVRMVQLMMQPVRAVNGMRARRGTFGFIMHNLARAIQPPVEAAPNSHQLVLHRGPHDIPSALWPSETLDAVARDVASDDERREAAIRALGDQRTDESRGILTALQSDEGLDGALRTAAGFALNPLAI